MVLAAVLAYYTYSFLAARGLGRCCPQRAPSRVVLLVQMHRRDPLEASVVQQLQMSGAVILCMLCRLRLGY